MTTFTATTTVTAAATAAAAATTATHTTDARDAATAAAVAAAATTSSSAVKISPMALHTFCSPRQQVQLLCRLVWPLFLPASLTRKLT